MKWDIIRQRKRVPLVEGEARSKFPVIVEEILRAEPVGEVGYEPFPAEHVEGLDSSMLAK